MSLRRKLLENLKNDEILNFRISVFRILFRIEDLFLEYFPPKISVEIMATLDHLFVSHFKVDEHDDFLDKLKKFNKVVKKMKKMLLEGNSVEIWEKFAIGRGTPNFEKSVKTFFKDYNEILENLKNLIEAYKNKDMNSYIESDRNNKYNKYQRLPKPRNTYGSDNKADDESDDESDVKPNYYAYYTSPKKSNR